MGSKSRADAHGAAATIAVVVVATALLAFTTLAVSARAAIAADFKTEYAAGVAAFKAGDAEKALAQFEKAYKIRKHPLCLFGMAQAHKKLGHVDLAISYFEKYIATKPDADLEKEVRGYLDELHVEKKVLSEIAAGRKLFTSGDFAGASAAYERAFALKPESETLLSAAASLERAGERTRALDAYERYLVLVPAGGHADEAKAAAARLRPPVVRPDLGDGGDGDLGTKVDSSRALSSDAEPAPSARKGGSRVGLWLGIGGGALVVLGGGAVAAYFLLRPSGPDVPPTDFGNMTAGF